MTKSTKPTTRETAATVFSAGKDRPVVVTIEGKLITLRLKGEGKHYSLHAGALYLHAAAGKL